LLPPTRLSTPETTSVIPSISRKSFILSQITCQTLETKAYGVDINLLTIIDNSPTIFENNEGTAVSIPSSLVSQPL
jgi:hypothetical protein